MPSATATVPFVHESACRTPQYSANSRSKRSTKLPLDEIHVDSRHSRTYSSSRPTSAGPATGMRVRGSIPKRVCVWNTANRPCRLNHAGAPSPSKFARQRVSWDRVNGLARRFVESASTVHGLCDPVACVDREPDTIAAELSCLSQPCSRSTTLRSRCHDNAWSTRMPKLGTSYPWSHPRSIDSATISEPSTAT